MMNEKGTEMTNDICDLYINGKSIKSIAFAFDITKAEVVAILEANELV